MVVLWDLMKDGMIHEWPRLRQGQSWPAMHRDPILPASARSHVQWLRDSTGVLESTCESAIGDEVDTGAVYVRTLKEPWRRTVRWTGSIPDSKRPRLNVRGFNPVVLSDNSLMQSYHLAGTETPKRILIWHKNGAKREISVDFGRGALLMSSVFNQGNELFLCETQQGGRGKEKVELWLLDLKGRRRKIHERAGTSNGIMTQWLPGGREVSYVADGMLHRVRAPFRVTGR